MLRANRQLSQGSVEEEGPPFQRRRSSIGRAEENNDRNRHIPPQEQEIALPTGQPTMYYQPCSNGPIFNGAIYGNIQNNMQVSTLDGLQFLYQHAAMGAIHESDERYPPPLCHPGTRDVVVGQAIGWYLDKSGRKKGIMWVHAPAGFGKTAIAGTVTEKLKQRAKELGFTPIGATFYFWRNSPERNSPARFIITLAYQLGQSIPELGPRVEAVVKSKPDIVKMALELQLVTLIVEPFKSLSNLEAMPNRLVVVDGIDECISSDRESRLDKKYAEDQETTQIRVLELIRSLESHHLPLSFLILSRPEAWIKQHIGSTPFRDVVEPLDLYEVGDHMNDVAKFVRAELSRIATTHDLGNVDEEWAEEEKLVWRSKGQMVYASTAIRHIDDPYGDPRQLLKDIVDNTSTTSPDISHSTAFSSLYELYGQIMRSCPRRNRAVLIDVLADIMSDCRFKNYGYKPALEVLDRLSGRSPGCGVKALRPLHGVLRFEGSKLAMPLKYPRGGEISINDLFIHSSFREFLQSPHASPDFYVDVSKRKEWRLSKMLDYMPSITFQDIVFRKTDEVTMFVSLNFWNLWDSGMAEFFGTRASHMKKIVAVDLSAWIILRYISTKPSNYRHFFSAENQTPSKYLINGNRNLDRCEDTLSTAVHEDTSHWQSCFESAAIFLLHPNANGTPLGSLEFSVRSIAVDCIYYLREVVTQPGSRENKLVQALGSPGPGKSGLFEEVVDRLYQALIRQSRIFTHGDPFTVAGWRWYKQSKGNELQRVEAEVGRLVELLDKSQQWAWDILEHLYQVMVRDQNPVLEEGIHPFDLFLYIRDRRRAWEAAQDALPPVVDVVENDI